MNESYKIYPIILAGGSSSRFGGGYKQFEILKGKKIVDYSSSLMMSIDELEIPLVIFPKTIKEQYVLECIEGPTYLRVGGATRQTSLLNGLTSLAESHKINPLDIILIHDACRPFLNIEDLENLISGAKKDKVGAVLCYKLTEAISYVIEGNIISKPLDDSKIWIKQTPQAFRFSILIDCIKTASYDFRDSSSALIEKGYIHSIVESKHPNTKVTRLTDLELF